MKVPLRWLEDYVDISLPIEELTRKLTFAGLEVEALRYVGLPLPENPERLEAKVAGLEWDPETVVVGEVVEVRPHPDADRLVLADLRLGTEQLTSVTGAPNLFPYRGQGPLAEPLTVAVALPGARLIDSKTGEPRRFEPATIRGTLSAAMICSERELDISEAHEGVILFGPGSAALETPEPGTPLADFIGDVVLDIAVTPNMVRTASIVGVAREVAALTGSELRLPSLDVEMTGPPTADMIRIDIRRPDLNPRFTATLLDGIEIGPSPYWLQLRLLLAGMRPISNIVDLTNYVMLELGQPLHAFDYDVLVERARASGSEVPTIITRMPDPGERLETLDGVDRAIDDFTILVTDEMGALALGGIMGGGESEISDSTTRVLLEAAAWNFINIRRSTQAQQLSSEAGYRFSRGVHPADAPRGNLRAIELMRQLAGGTVYQGLVDVYPQPHHDSVVEMPFGEVERALGIEIPREEVIRILEALEFGALDDGDMLRVTAPDHRLDIGEGVIGIADLMEEISRIYGYERIPETQIEDAIPPQKGNPELETEEAVRDLLVDLGLQEVVTYRLTTPEREARARKTGSEPDARPFVELKKPISEDRRVMRHELLPSVLEIAETNARRDGLAIFEIGQVFLAQEGEDLPEEPRRLAIVMAGLGERGNWSRGEPKELDFYDLKGTLDGLAEDLHLEDCVFEAAEHPTFHPGRCARLRVGGEEIGVFGELHPRVRAAYDVPFARVLAADLDLEKLQAAIPERYPVHGISSFPPVVEDLALVVDDGVTAAAVESCISRAAGDLLRAVELFDHFRGEQIGEGKKSLAYRLTYQSDDRTLTDQEVAAVRQQVVAAVEQQLGGRLRS
ncbi:MAG: phenylalanine--tRNA ligase subunit beta [bacterium]|nr:phenylalanine--tRNA ligase subunit beta [bacterium]